MGTVASMRPAPRSARWRSRAAAATRHITFTVSRTALGGTPALGCTAAAAAANPICALDPATVPPTLDGITAADVSPANELNPLAGPVAIQRVTIP